MKIDKNKPKPGKARRSAQPKKFRSSFARKRIQKPGQKSMARGRKTPSKNRRETSTHKGKKRVQETKAPQLSHKEERSKSKDQLKEMNHILKLQIEAGLESGMPCKKLLEICGEVKMRGLKQRLLKKIRTHYPKGQEGIQE